MDFLEVEKPDILSLVEASDGDFFGSGGGKQRDYVGELSRRFGWNAVFHPTVFRDMGEYQINWGAAVLSSFPVVLENALYFGDQKPTILPNSHITFSDKPKYERYPYAWKFNLPFLVTKITIGGGIDLRLLSAHFHVSYECLETLQIWQDAERVVEYLNTHDDGIPTILTGDLNIRNESMAIKIIREKLAQQSESFKNTLCRSIHPYFQRVPDGEGLGIDHIFTKNVSVSSCDVRDVAVSDHLPLILQFDI